MMPELTSSQADPLMSAWRIILHFSAISQFEIFGKLAGVVIMLSAVSRESALYTAYIIYKV